MKWLRMRPADMNELDESRRWHEVYGDEGGGEEGGKGGEVGGRRKKVARTRRRGGGAGVGVRDGGEGVNGGGGEL